MLMHNYAPTNTASVDHYFVSHQHQKFMLYKTVTENDTKFSKIVDRVSMPNMHPIPQTRRTILYLWSYATRHYRGGQAAGRATNQKTIHHVRSCSSKSSIEEYSIRGRRYGNATESQQLKKARDYLGSAKEHSYGPIVDRYLEDEQHQMRTHEQGYTQSDLQSCCDDHFSSRSFRYAVTCWRVDSVRCLRFPFRCSNRIIT